MNEEIKAALEQNMWVTTDSLEKLNQITKIAKPLFNSSYEVNFETDIIKAYMDKNGVINAFIIFQPIIGLIVKAIWVRENLRKQKIATCILQDTIEHFKDKTFTAILYAEIDRGNKPSLNFFESIGFKPIGFNKLTTPDGTSNNIVMIAHIENRKIKPQKEFVELMQKMIAYNKA